MSNNHAMSIRNYNRAKDIFLHYKYGFDEMLLLKTAIVAELSECINCTDTSPLEFQKRLLNERLKDLEENLEKASCLMDFFWRRAMYYRRVNKTILIDEREIPGSSRDIP